MTTEERTCELSERLTATATRLELLEQRLERTVANVDAKIQALAAADLTRATSHAEQDVLEHGSIRETIAALERYLANVIENSANSVKIAFEANEKAIDKAAASTEKRFESVNEFRQTLSDQAGEFVRKPETEFLAEKINLVATRIERIEAKGQGLSTGWGYLVAAVSLIAVVITIFISVVHLLPTTK